MKLSGIKKILLLGLILLIIAGIVVVALKGFNVSLTCKQHESISLYIGKEINMNDVKTICKDVFGNKNFILRDVELFNDSFSISVETITNEEKEELINKINEKYGTNFSAENVKVNTNSNIRIRDLVKPYLKPVVVSAVLIAVYLVIRFRKVNAFKLLGTILGEIVLTEFALASFIAIVRIPLSPILINIMASIAVIELLVYINNKEKSKKEVNE